MYKNREKEERGRGRWGAEGGIATVAIATAAIATVGIAIVAINTVAITTVSIATVAIATVNLTTVIIATVIRSFKVLLGDIMIDARCMADCYPPVAVGG